MNDLSLPLADKRLGKKLLSKNELFFFALLFDPGLGIYFIEDFTGRAEKNSLAEPSIQERNAVIFMRKLVGVANFTQSNWDKVRKTLSELENTPGKMIDLIWKNLTDTQDRDLQILCNVWNGIR